MEAALIAQVRRFNRMVSQRVGALDDRFLARGRPLGEARVLWEMGDDGRDIRSLRAQLGLDSGYLSRLLRSLESARMIRVEANGSDRRIRTARLTRKGRAERAVLNRRSDDLAASLLEPLTPAQRTRLTDAMAEVERLLMATTVEIAPIDPAHPSAQYCLEAYFDELNHRFDTGFDSTRGISATNEELRPPAGLMLLASLHSEPIGCGALKFHDDAPAEIKRMWVAESARGLGVGRRLLVEIEARASARGVTTVRLETNGTLAEAISLYRSAGYAEVERFNDEPYAHHWFEKQLLPASPEGLVP